MEPDRWSLYRDMLRSRRFEEAVRELWERGAISGEMHMGLGEEAVAVGVVDHLEEGDAMALDHRGTPPLVARGVDLVLLLKEFLGRPDGLCSGMGGHMHLFSPDHLAASSGIVGASGPSAVGFALAAQLLRPGKLAIAFFGEGAMNQGMLMESLNLAASWKLPVLFVCKDDAWAITTRSPDVTGGSLTKRAEGFGLPAQEVDGTDVDAVWAAAAPAVARARRGKGPSFLLAHCSHLEGHFLGDPLRRVIRKPVEQVKQMAGPMLRSATQPKGASLPRRAASLGAVTSLLGKSAARELWRRDPVERTRRLLSKADSRRLEKLEQEVVQQIGRVLDAVEREQ